jgi:ubiquinol-cytochrome c reductase cytochrome b subunit
MALRPMSKFLFWCFVVITLILGWIGAKPVEYPFLEIGQIASFLYFSYFYIMAPLIIEFEFFFFMPRFNEKLNMYVFGLPK